MKSRLVRHYLTDEARRGFIIEYQSQQSLPDWSDDTVIPEVPQDSDNLVETWQTARCLLQFSPCFHRPHARICSNRLNKSTPKQWPRRGAIVFCMENLFMAQTRLIVFTENEPRITPSHFVLFKNLRYRFPADYRIIQLGIDFQGCNQQLAVYTPGPVIITIQCNLDLVFAGNKVVSG